MRRCTAPSAAVRRSPTSRAISRTPRRSARKPEHALLRPLARVAAVFLLEGLIARARKITPLRPRSAEEGQTVDALAASRLQTQEAADEGLRQPIKPRMQRGVGPQAQREHFAEGTHAPLHLLLAHLAQQIGQRNPHRTDHAALVA